MERRRLIHSVLAGSIGVGRIVAWLSDTSETTPRVYTCSTRGRQRTFEFSLAPQERAYLLLNYSDNIRLSYILRTTDGVPVDVGVIKHDGAVTDPDATHTRYPALSHRRRSEVSDSQVVLTGAGQYAVTVTNPADRSVSPLGDAPDAHVTYSFVVSDPGTADDPGL